ncbi:MAG: SGNH/GDSL hydrolase family protein [Planctomycetes bacterium]|nr:SGNH/GDSL hydrolase family protein [Planctomycetota bacterium]
MNFRKILIGLGVSAATVVLLALVAGFATTLTKPGQRVIFQVVPRVGYMRAPSQKGYERGNEDFGEWVPLTVNSLGLRGGEIPEHKLTGEKRILCIGDSFVFGGGLGDNDTFPAHAQQLCAAPPETIRWMNAGGNGHDGRESAGFLELYYPKLRPDITIFGWNWNDLISITGESSQKFENNLHNPLADGLAGFFHVEPLTIRRFSIMKWLDYYRNPYKWEEYSQDKFNKYRNDVIAGATGANSEAAWQVSMRVLNRMSELCKQNGGKYFVLAMPELTWKESETFVGMPRLAAVLEKLNIPFVDAQPAYYEAVKAGRHMVQRLDPTHPSAEGQRVIAQTTLDALWAQGILQKRN